jgi:hypothetical protein
VKIGHMFTSLGFRVQGVGKEKQVKIGHLSFGFPSSGGGGQRLVCVVSPAFSASALSLEWPCTHHLVRSDVVPYCFCSLGSVEFTDGERRRTWFDHFLGLFTGANERKKMAALTKQEQTITIIRIDIMQYWWENIPPRASGLHLYFARI